MRIIENFMFYNEFEMLEVKLNIMGDYVDQFNIVEIDKTHSGQPKEFNLEKQWDRYAKWHHKINYIKVSDFQCQPDSWDNERGHRNLATLAWNDITDEDVIIISDCDEIIRPEALKYIRESNFDYYGLMMPLFYFKFNYMLTNDVDGFTVWPIAYRGIKSKGLIPSQLRRGWNDRQTRDRSHFKNGVIVNHAGWHFSWFGDDEHIAKKIKSFAHTEFNNDHILGDLNIDNCIERGDDHLKRGMVKWKKVKFDNYFPQYLLDNKEKYSTRILDSDEPVTNFIGTPLMTVEGM